MGKIGSRLTALRGRGERALVTFVTAGDPQLDQLPSILDALSEGGADLLEVGIPFSDPIADGPVIQASSQRALERGTTPEQVLGILASWTGPEKPPVVLMGYLNPILRRGLASFCRDASAAGVDGMIVCDLTPDEASEWVAAAGTAGIDPVFLVAPTSTEERVAAVAEASRGFVYAVSRTGVTGAASHASRGARDLVERVRRHTDTPVCVGFGISAPEHVREVCRYADGAIVGSSLVELVERIWEQGKGRYRVVEYVAGLKAATRLG